MNRLMALDVATNMGWSFYDTDKHPSAIECGAINLSPAGADEMTGVEKRRLMRIKIDEEVCGLIDRFRPDVACIEQPLNWIKPQGGGPKKPPKMFKDDAAFSQEATAKKPGTEKGGPNADTVLMLNQLFAVANTVCMHKCKLVIEVAPKTWQRITSQFDGDAKAKSIAFCRQMRIELPPGLTKIQKGDAADAAAIANWAAGHAQELKLMQRAA